MNASRFAFALALLATPVFVAACDCSGPTTPAGRCTSDRDCHGGQVCIDSMCSRPTDGGTGHDSGGGGPMDTGVPPSDAWGSCTTSASCGTGYECTSGMCCASASVCGVACCDATQTCFAGACVVPGATCRTNSDCASGEYCEPALGVGGGDGGVSDAGTGGPDAGRACTAPTVAPGRCLALPPACPTLPDGGMLDGGTASCTTMCEYRPTVGMLRAEVAWNWGEAAPPPTQPNQVDVWSTPAVGRLYDANCDGVVDELDPPNVVFVSGRTVNASGVGTNCQGTGATPTGCHTGVLRALDGRTGETVWSLRSGRMGSMGFAGTAVALGDVDANGSLDVVALTGEGYVVLVDGTGHVLRTSDMPVPGAEADNTFGWGGGLAIADMDGDGFPEIAYGATLFRTTGGTITRAWTGAGAGGGALYEQISTFADVDEDGDLELVAGRTVYRADGTMLWNQTSVPDGFPGIADLNGDGAPEVIVVGGGRVHVLAGATGAAVFPAFTLPGMGAGGPPTVADFDGDHHPEIGVAQQNQYTVVDVGTTTLTALWSRANHDLSSSVTGSTVFDFEGDGRAEVIYADECYLWVFDGVDGHVRFTSFTSSFTGTEASIVADVDGDGHAEMLLVSNAADPSSSGWGCMDAAGTPSVVNGVSWARGPALGSSYRGLRMFRDPARTWVGTRPIWNEATYHVTNICVPPDGACAPGATYGSIPRVEQRNWELTWLDNFRQNVQESGVFDAADATLVLEVHCADPVQLVASLRNVGAAILPPGVVVDFFRVDAGGTEVALGSVTSTTSVFPGALTQLTLPLPAGADPTATYRARIDNPSAMPTFRECREDNDTSPDATGHCLM